MTSLTLAAIDVDTDVTARVGRVHSTHYPSRHNSVTSTSGESISTSKTATSSQIQPTSATKPVSYAASASTKSSEPAKASSGSTIYNIQEQLQPPSVNAQQYLYTMQAQPHATPGTTQMMIPEGRTFYINPMVSSKFTKICFDDLMNVSFQPAPS